MAATSNPLATEVAVRILRQGGNAVDAAVAAVAVQCVVEPAMTGIGGDCFVLYAPNGGGTVIALNGSGRAPAAARFDWYAREGISEIGLETPHAVTVPGAVDAWARLVADHGTMPLGELLAPAIDFAENGYPVHARVAADWAAYAGKIGASEAGRRIFLPRGRAPRMGEMHRLPELGRTLRLIAEGGRDAFYTGPVAEDVVATLRDLGGLHTPEDFAATRCEYVDPIRTTYRDVEVYECPPNGQGIVALIMLNILKGFDLDRLDPDGPERFHLEAEAGKLAYALRNRFVADPDVADIPVEELLSEGYAARLRERIRPDRAGDGVPPDLPAHRDTIYLTVVDRDRNAVSFINSLFHPFGSGIVAGRSGVLLQNRGAGFRIDPRHPNGIAPRKRPLHTIIPGMVLKDGRAVMPFGVMGGQYQPVGHAHVLTNMLDYGMDPQAALEHPRAFAFGGTLDVEARIREDTARALAALGHNVQRAPNPHGSGQIIAIDWEEGILTGGSDPRRDGCAFGF